MIISFLAATRVASRAQTGGHGLIRRSWEWPWVRCTTIESVALLEHDRGRRARAWAAGVAEAEREGADRYPLYELTKATIENPAKKAKYLKSFMLYVRGEEVYAKEAADALEADLQPLVGGGSIVRLARYDTNPANIPQPPARSRT